MLVQVLIRSMLLYVTLMGQEIIIFSDLVYFFSFFWIGYLFVTILVNNNPIRETDQKIESDHTDFIRPHDLA